MASLAGLLHETGHHVEGVDSQLSPPRGTLLDALGIPVRIGFDPELIPAGIDRVIIGNAVPRSNPEVEAVTDRGLHFLSQAEAVAHYVLGGGPRSLVVAGTHGKTTTASLLTWILETAGADPSALVGGLMSWSQRSFRSGRGPWIVVEGDEYNTAFFDRGPKFLHYRPHLFLLGPVEFDHADIYRDLDAVLTAFRAGSAQVPLAGAVVVSGWNESSLAAVRDAAAPVIVVGPAADNDLRLTAYRAHPAGGAADVRWRGQSLKLDLPLAGEHNMRNAAMALAAALYLGIEGPVATAALACFPGVARRLEVVGESAGVVVVDDFAHHPTALAATISAARTSWPDRRLVVAFEPRSITAARRSFQERYTEALAGADVALVVQPFHRRRLPPEEVLDTGAIADGLAALGVSAIIPGEDDDAVSALLGTLRRGDVVVGCSSGSFSNFHRRLLRALATGNPLPEKGP